MKKLLIALLIMLFAVPCFAGRLYWSAPTTGPTPTGYKIYYHDGTTQYSKIVGDVLEVQDFENVLNLNYDIEYTMYCVAYNLVAESGPSNELTFTREGYVPDDNPNTTTIINIPPGNPVQINVEN